MTIEVRGKRHALFLDLSQSRKRKHLESAAVGQDRAVPAHEFMETAHLPHHIIAGAQMQMVGVGKLDLTAEILQIKGAHAAFDGRLRADVHKDRRLHFPAVRAPEFAAPRTPLVFDNLKHTLSSTLKK